MRQKKSKKRNRSFKERLQKKLKAYRNSLTEGGYSLEKPKVKYLADERKRFYRCRELNIHQINYLLHKNYRISYQRNILKNSEHYLLKPENRWETSEHFFLVQHLTKYLQQFFKLELAQTRKPDIVFEFRNKKIAIEVETGKVLSSKQKFLNKVQLNNEHFGEDWFFVVSNRKLLKKYKPYAKTYTRNTVLEKLHGYVKNQPQNQHPSNYRNKVQEAKILY